MDLGRGGRRGRCFLSWTNQLKWPSFSVPGIQLMHAQPNSKPTLLEGGSKLKTWTLFYSVSGTCCKDRATALWKLILQELKLELHLLSLQTHESPWHRHHFFLMCFMPLWNQLHQQHIYVKNKHIVEKLFTPGMRPVLHRNGSSRITPTCWFPVQSSSQWAHPCRPHAARGAKFLRKLEGGFKAEGKVLVWNVPFPIPAVLQKAWGWVVAWKTSEDPCGWWGCAINPKTSFPSSSLKLFPAELANPMCWDSTAGGYTRCCLGWGLQRGRANRAQGFGLRLFRICNLHGDTSRAEKRICSQLQGVATDWLSRLLCCIALYTVLKQREYRLLPTSQLLNWHKLQWCHHRQWS